MKAKKLSNAYAQLASQADARSAVHCAEVFNMLTLLHDSQHCIISASTCYSAHYYDRPHHKSHVSNQAKYYSAVMGVSTAAASAAAANRTLTAAVDQLNTAVALQPAFWPALVEKAKLLAAAGDWEQARDTAARVTAAEPTNVRLLHCHLLYALFDCIHDISCSSLAFEVALLSVQFAAIRSRYSQ
jgi:hypothetical protein